MDGVIVLHAALPGQFDAQRERELLAQLPYAKRLEFERRDPRARRASIAGIDLLLRGAARLAGASIHPGRLRFPDAGKPYFEYGPAFSLSHSRTRVAVAISADGAVGLDIEDGEMASAYRSDAAALERWVATEAALKLQGAGLRSARDVVLAADLSSASVAGTTVYLQPLLLGVGIVARLATPTAIASPGIEEI